MILLQCESWKMSWLKLTFSMSCWIAVPNLAQSVVTYQASVYVIGFLVMVKEGEKQQMTFRWNSIQSIHITSVETREWIDLQRGTLTVHCGHCAQAVNKATFEWHVRTGLHTPRSCNHVSIFSFFQAFAIPGQYAFAHQDVSMFFWVTDICPVDLLLPTPSKPPLCPPYTLLCKDEISVTLIFWHH